MKSISQSVREKLGRFAASERLTVLESAVPSLKIDDPRAIVSSVPEVRIAWGQESFRGRRARLAFERGTRSARFLLRRRESPVDLEDPAMIIQWARNRSGKRIAVSSLDTVSRTLHVLVDFETALPVRDESGPRARELAFETTIATPLREVLSRARTHVGAEVKEQVRTFLQASAPPFDTAARQEYEALLPLAEQGELPHRWMRNFRWLRGLVKAMPRRDLRSPEDRISEDRVAEEIARLERLVASRACGAIRFEDQTITGLLHPRPLPQGWRLAPVRFRFRSVPAPERARLEVWDAREPRRYAHGECLGMGTVIFPQLRSDLDCYGLVDATINFTERNPFPFLEHGPGRRMGRLRFHTHRPPRTRGGIR